MSFAEKIVMAHQTLKVLLVDDDTALLKVLSGGIEKAGYQVIPCSTADEALSKARHSDFNVAVVDCMLPKINGVDLVQKLKPMAPKAAFIFISGIYKDRSFITETLNSTLARHFLTKPFNLSELTQILDTYAKTTKTVRNDSWLEFWNQGHADAFFKKLSELKSINGQEIPYLMSLILQYSIDGTLKIKVPEIQAEIFFERGRLMKIVSSDKISFFGALLIQSGMISAEEIEPYLQAHAGRKDPIGESLVKAQLLSPHAIEQTLKQQTLIRISQLISTLPTVIEWKPTPPQKHPAPADKNDDKGLLFNDLAHYFYNWSQSKIKAQWLRAQYVTWLEDCPRVNPKATGDLPLELQEILKKCDGNNSINDLIQSAENSDQLLAWLHGLFLANKIHWGGHKTKSSEIERIRHKLEVLEKNFKESDHFAILGISQTAKQKDIKKAYLDLSKSLHPDQLPPDAPSDLKTLSSRVFTHITLAHETLGDLTSRDNYIKDLHFKSLKAQAASQQSMYQALGLIERKAYKQAYDAFMQIKQTAWQTPNLELYCLWADLKRRENISPEESRLFGQKLNDLTPEERHSYLFFFVKGLLALCRKLPEEAKACFQNSLVLNPQFKPASVELQTLTGNKTNFMNLFNSSSKKPA